MGDNDSTDTVLATLTAVVLAVCGFSAAFHAWRSMNRTPAAPGMKPSPSMEQLTSADPTNNV